MFSLSSSQADFFICTKIHNDITFIKNYSIIQLHVHTHENDAARHLRWMKAMFFAAYAIVCYILYPFTSYK